MNTARAAARVRAKDRVTPLQAAAALAFGMILALAAATLARADETIIKAHGFAEFGELKYPEGFAHFDYVNPEAPKGGELSISAVGTFDSMNPFTRKGRAGMLASSHYESLLVESYDEPGSYYGLVAESLEYPESQDWVIFNLRPEARFSDGTPVTAEDVVFSHNILLDQGLKSYAEAVRKRIPKAEALGPHRVKFHFSPDFPRRAMISQVGGTPVFSKAWFEADPENRRIDEPRLDPGIGSGPYVLESADVNQRIVYKRNPDYWGKDLNVNTGRHNYDRIRVEYFGDAIAAMEGFKAGVYTLRTESNSKSWATAYDFAAVDNGLVIKAEIPDGNVPAAAGFVMNLLRPKFQDIRVREAMQLAFNFEWTNESLQYGLFRHRSSFWQDTPLAATGLPEGREKELLEALGDQIDPSILTSEPVMAHASKASRPGDRKNLRRGMKLLDEAGWTVGDDGMRRNAEGTPLKIEFLVDSPTIERIVQPYVANLRTMGVDAVVNRVDYAQFTSRRREKEIDMIFTAFPMSLEPSTGLQQYFGSEAHEYSVFNPAGLADPAVDVLIDGVIEAKTLEDLRANVRALDRVLRAKRFMVPTWYLDVNWVAYWDMYRQPENLPPYDTGLLDLWWIDAAREAELKAAGALR
ncbi:MULTISPECIES: extracellular solute-binding protein [unclassified Leisingera]|uniref:extracellular solute-binding protein n=2 Tax=Leisingera TaxID=191028 RepID=UPI0002E5537B|nr:MULTISPECIES: extracellular solute-binding protein [unclassified Leisingera]KIC23410.1 peptide ABC transporter substrate-binding protein [Leisingera sp. ANG-S3]KIC30977.1 peptide ABC transporter substrate-binding protein [Leisingera sp. ANG-M6]KIC54891.1 peptide ABC transporter substrate-binding protein [Leisingera sp. ANG-S]KID08588.1 peptide ABC transporter substrate-binding protein [Leisingera sp. ANG1]